MEALYDSIGLNYSRHRSPDPTIASAICNALGTAESVVNVGAGTGSYEPTDRHVVSVEPSRKMIDQRFSNSRTSVLATATALPFSDNAFDAALAVLTVHHWDDQIRGLSELRRVARERTVIFTWNPDSDGFWLTDYFPEILDVDRRIFPPVSDYERALGKVAVEKVPIPRHCKDGFLCAYWRRPHAYLDPERRSSISTFSKIASAEEGFARLSSDLASGVWHERNRELQDLEFLDLGYCLIIAEF